MYGFCDWKGARPTREIPTRDNPEPARSPPGPVMSQIPVPASRYIHHPDTHQPVPPWVRILAHPPSGYTHRARTRCTRSRTLINLRVWDRYWHSRRPWLSRTLTGCGKPVQCDEPVQCASQCQSRPAQVLLLPKLSITSILVNNRH